MHLCTAAKLLGNWSLSEAEWTWNVASSKEHQARGYMTVTFPVWNPVVLMIINIVIYFTQDSKNILDIWDDCVNHVNVPRMCPCCECKVITVVFAACSAPATHEKLPNSFAALHMRTPISMTETNYQWLQWTLRFFVLHKTLVYFTKPLVFHDSKPAFRFCTFTFMFSHFHCKFIMWNACHFGILKTKIVLVIGSLLCFLSLLYTCSLLQRIA